MLASRIAQLLKRLAFAAALLWPMSSPSAGGVSKAPSVVIRVSGPSQVVLNWSAHACPKSFIPDAPARAFRDMDGAVRLIATSFENWSFVGPTLDAMTPDCQAAFRGAERSDPLAFDDRGWIEATYTSNGRRVYALISNEWDSFRHFVPNGAISASCGLRQYQPACMAYSINLAVSDNGGRNFNYTMKEGQQVISGDVIRAKQPAGDLGRRADGSEAPRGSPTVSNIVARNGFFYAMVYVRGQTSGQDGNCLLRTEDLGNPAQWRAWDGKNFTVRPVNFGDKFPSAIPCARVARRVLGWDVRSLSWYAPSNSYIAIMHAASVNPEGRRVVGVHYATSPDLLQWSDTRLLVEAPSRLNSTCQPPMHYPAMLDPASSSRNFETVGGSAYIYYTEFNVQNCRISLDRDLRRFAVTIQPAG